MLRKLGFLMNAMLFGCAGALAVGTAAPRQVAALVKRVLPSAATPSLRPAAKAATRPLTLAQSNALAPAAATASDAIVPPIVRRRPGKGAPAASAEPAPVKRPAPVKTAKAEKSPAITTRVVKTAAVSPAPGSSNASKNAQASKKPIDLSGRSALGAAPKGVKCNTGLKYDSKTLRCVAVAPKPAAQPKPVKMVKAAPAPAPAVSPLQ